MLPDGSVVVTVEIRGVGIGIRAVRHEPSALPCKGAAVPCPGVAYVVIIIGYTLTIELYEKIAPAVGISFLQP